jgi:hypothetical protein
LAPQIKPHELNKAKERLEQLDIKGTLDLITRVDLSETKASLQLDVVKVAALVQLDTGKLDLEYLRIEEPVVLRMRTNGSKLTWVGYKGEPNHSLMRAIVTAQVWVDEIKAGRSMSDIMQSHKILESGARGRNRTTDTRIFNRNGNKYLNEYSNLYVHKFAVCKSVFLLFRQFGSNTVSITNGGTQCLAQFSNKNLNYSITAS